MKSLLIFLFTAALLHAADKPADVARQSLEIARARLTADIAAWQERRIQVTDLMIEPPAECIAAVDRVLACLKAEFAAREALATADLAIIDAEAGPLSQMIHPVRPFNDLQKETKYAGRMLEILQPQANASEAEAARFRQLGQTWKKQNGDQAGAIDRWLELMTQRQQLIQQAVQLYATRDDPRWYDRACLVGKFDLAIGRLLEDEARRSIKPVPEAFYLRARIAAEVAVYQVLRDTYSAMTDFNKLMTRESPLMESSVKISNPPTITWELERLFAAPEIRWLGTDTRVRRVLYRGEPYQGHPTEVFAYVATPGSVAGNPALDGDLPAIVLIHGGGDRAFPDWVTFWAKHGYAAIAMDLAGCGPNVSGEYDKLYKPERLLRGGPGQDGRRKILDIDLPLTDQWPFHAVANVILAHSLIRSLPGVDAERTAIAGISWGGYLTCMVAGIDTRFKAAMPFYGCGFLAENSIWKDMGLFEQLSADQQRQWTSLWDPSVYAPHIQAPVFCVTGASDFAYPLESFAKTYALLAGSRSFRITPDMGHGAQFLTSTPEAVVFIDSILKGGSPLPSFGKPKPQGARLAVRVDGEELKEAHFHYTTESGPNRTRTWYSTDAQIDANTLSAPLPDKLVIGYFTVVDARGLIVSTEPYLPEQVP